MSKIKNLKIKIFADGASIKDMFLLNKKNYISGFTTNPSLMKQASITDYKTFAMQILKKINSKSVSFEVTSDSFNEMESQALEIKKWSKNIFIKIPFTNSKGKKTIDLIKRLSNRGLKLNITSVFTYEQMKEVLDVLNKNSEAYISIFAGRIADTGRDPVKIIKKSVIASKKFKKVSILWASCREIYNIFEADKAGCHIITVPHSILKKFSLIGKNLERYSVETAKDFYLDSKDIIFKF
jgi:transaldolase